MISERSKRRDFLSLIFISKKYRNSWKLTSNYSRLKIYLITGSHKSKPHAGWNKVKYTCPIMLSTHMITDQIGLHSVLLPLLIKSQYPHTNSPNWSLYISLKNELREFDKRSKHFLVGDHFINSHNLISWQCMDIVRRNLMLVTIGTYRVNCQNELSGYP